MLSPKGHGPLAPPVIHLISHHFTQYPSKMPRIPPACPMYTPTMSCQRAPHDASPPQAVPQHAIPPHIVSTCPSSRQPAPHHPAQPNSWLIHPTGCQHAARHFQCSHQSALHAHQPTPCCANLSHMTPTHPTCTLNITARCTTTRQAALHHTNRPNSWPTHTNQPNCWPTHPTSCQLTP